VFLGKEALNLIHHEQIGFWRIKIYKLWNATGWEGPRDGTTAVKIIFYYPFDDGGQRKYVVGVYTTMSIRGKRSSTAAKVRRGEKRSDFL